MNAFKLLGLSMLAVFVILTASAAAAPHEAPPTPAPVTDVVSIRPFTLEKGYQHLWRAEKPKVNSGYLLVLKVDGDLVIPRQTAEPVLYVGNQTAERVNIGQKSGYVVAIVPAVLDDPEHPGYLDLDKALMWFGTPELPERVTARMIEQERDLAERSGITPPKQAAMEAAREKGGERLNAVTKSDLLHHAGELVRKYSPQETELIDRLLRSEPR